MIRERLAPAKVNLFLHVGPPGADGYHPICSLMAFADVGDRISVAFEDEEGLSITGPFAAGLSARDDNLVARARGAAVALAPSPPPPFRLILDKQLPIASGLGGGSSDAAATLQLLRGVLGLTVTDAAWADVALRLGSDVPACLEARAAIARGRGEILAACPPFPDLDVVLVNPGLASPTAEVYRAYDAAISPHAAAEPAWSGPLATIDDVAVFLSECRNDLQAAAIGLRADIGATLASLAREPETLLARMSGSGATCFALCQDADMAARLAARLTAREPAWWVRSCRLGGSRSK